MNEDNLVQEPTANYLADPLGWESVYAYNLEVFSASEAINGRVYLGRKSDREVVLSHHLRAALEKLNPGLPKEAYDNAVRQITEVSSAQSMLQTNREKYALLRGGVKVSFRTQDGIKKQTLRVFDFNNPENNNFLAVRELWVKGSLYRRRADIVGFVNGLPLLFMELKNVNRDIRHAYEENFSDYKDTVPHLFHFNAFVVLGNGKDAKLGSLTAPFRFFRDWKRLDEDEPGVVDMQTLLKGVCAKANFLDLFENFILFDDSSENLVKIVAQNQQYLGVNKAIRSVEEREERQGKLGVFWHTQGAGKSYSMVFFSRKIHRRLGGNFTFLVLTDRDDLDGQIYKTFAGTGAVSENDEVRAANGKHLKTLLSQHKAYVFSLIQKFNQDVDPNEPYSVRDDIIVMIDEAHRSQYGRLSLNRKNALPNANYMAFTGTPLFKDGEITKRMFGDYVSKYGFERAVEDGATVPLYYDARGEKLGLATNELNEKIAAKLDEFEIEDVDVEQRLQKELGRDYHIITAPERLDQIARDFVKHYTTAWETGKAMFVCIDKITTVKMQGLIEKYWDERIIELKKELNNATDEQDEKQRQNQIAWMKETRIGVMISEEQGEVDKFRKWGLDILPHRRLIKEGFELDDGKRLDMETAFKRDGHPFRVAIVCAMWLTGFDVKSLSTRYLDKPLKAHTLMQTIARANRVFEGKNNGLIVDYCGILKNLRKALATYAGHTGDEDGGDNDPAKPDEELLVELVEAIEMVRGLLLAEDVRLEGIIEQKGFERIAAIGQAKEVINENDETRKRFEIMARQVFRMFKACLNIEGINRYRTDYDAINIIYKSLQEDREKADISHIIKELHGVIAEEIGTDEQGEEIQEGRIYDISAIDFERLKQEFTKSAKKQTLTQELKDVIEERLKKMLAMNPLRTDFQKRFEEMVEGYNAEKDQATIEATFEALWKLVKDLDEEASRAMREGLDEKTLALFDLLKKEDLSNGDIKQLKSVSKDLLAKLEVESQRISNWRAKESTRDGIKQTIHDLLLSDKTGLPYPTYSETEVAIKSDLVFSHYFYAMDRQREFV